VESETTENKNRITDIMNYMNGIHGNFCDLKSDNETNKEDIAELQMDNNDNNNNIEQLQTDVDQTKNDISEAQ
jgi:peptidoglycan hydrolase CwlO-like protein